MGATEGVKKSKFKRTLRAEAVERRFRAERWYFMMR